METGSIISSQQWQLWLQDPNRLEKGDMATLQKLQEQFPWMSATYKLMAYLAKREKLPSFSHWNQYAALTSSHKNELFDMLQKLNTTSIAPFIDPIQWIEDSEEEIEETSQNTEVAPIQAPSLAELVIREDTNHSLTPDIEDDWETIPLIPAEPTTTTEEVVAIQHHHSSTSMEIQDHIDLGELGHDIMSKAISSSIELEVSEPAHTENPEAEITTSTALSTMENVEWDDDFLNFIAESIGEKAETPTALNTPDKENLDVIERFIQKEPQITRGRVLDFEVGNMAKESLEEDYNLVTETMAKLYVKQGKIEKARKAYKKLIELFPEKSIYFATQLKNLNKKNQ